LSNKDQWDGLEYSRETEYIPQDRICIKDAINIECRVDDEGRGKNRIPYITRRIKVGGISWQWKTALWRISDIG